MKPKKNAFCKNVSWKKKVLMTLRALKKKKLGAATPLSSLISPPPSHHLRSLPFNSENLHQTLQNINKTKEQNKKQLIHGRRNKKEQISKRFYNIFFLSKDQLCDSGISGIK